VEEVKGSSAAAARRNIWSAVAFWSLAACGVGLFALSVLSTSYMERHNLRRELAVEQARIKQSEQYLEDLRVVRDALQENPKYVARQIRKDLGYVRSSERPLPFTAESGGPRLAPLDPELPPEPKVHGLCAVFSQPVLRHLSLTAGLMLLAMAFLMFEVPTKEETLTPPDGNRPGLLPPKLG